MIKHKQLIKSFIYAFSGLWYAIKNNQNIRIHIVIAIFVAILSVIFDITPFEMGILGISILLVISAEMINTSIEEMVDLITTEHRQQAKTAKDVAAGMVLVTAMGSVIVGILIFLPHILNLMHIKH